jgi:hypothetical protein
MFGAQRPWIVPWYAQNPVRLSDPPIVMTDPCGNIRK